MTPDEIAAIKWFHSIDLGGGEITPGIKAHDLLNQEAGMVFSYPVKNKTFLDVRRVGRIFLVRS